MSTALLLALLTASPSFSVERLLSARHGIPPSLHAEYAALCLDAASLDELVKWTEPDRLLPGQGALTNARARLAFEVLESWCGSKGQDLSVKSLRALRAARDKAWAAFEAGVSDAVKDPVARKLTRQQHGHYEQLLEVERASLLRFAQAKNPALVPDLLPRVKADVELQLAMVEYFGIVPGDPAVKSELTTLRKSTNSKALIAAIDAWLKLTP